MLWPKAHLFKCTCLPFGLFRRLLSGWHVMEVTSKLLKCSWRKGLMCQHMRKTMTVRYGGWIALVLQWKRGTSMYVVHCSSLLYYQKCAQLCVASSSMFQWHNVLYSQLIIILILSSSSLPTLPMLIPAFTLQGCCFENCPIRPMGSSSPPHWWSDNSIQEDDPTNAL